MTRSRFVEVRRVVRAGMTTYPGLPVPVLTPHLAGTSARAVDAELLSPLGAVRGHAVLLHSGEQLPSPGARFTAVPPRVAEFGTFPVRAFAAMP